MTDRLPIKPIFSGSDAIALGEFEPGDTLAVAQGGTGATSAAGARTALGLVIGTDVLAPIQVEYSIGNLGASYQLSIANGTKQRGVLNASCTLSLATPSDACTLRLRLVNSGAGNTITVSGVRWVGGTAPTFDTADTHENILVFDYGSTGWVADGGSI